MAEKTGRAHPVSYEALMKEIAKIGIERIPYVQPLKVRPTGIISLDLPLHGGLPVGRVVLWYGMEGSGKSSTWMLVAREFIKRGLPVLWIDAERTFVRDYAELLALDVDAVGDDGKPLFDLLKANSAEAVLDMLIMAMETRRHKLIVLDTLAKLVPLTEAAASLSKDQMGIHARLYSRGTRVWSEALDTSDATLVILNQERIDMGSYGAPKISGGGKAISGHEPTITGYMGRAERQVSKAGELQKLIFRFNIKKSKAFAFVPKISIADYFQIHIACSADHYEIDYPYELFLAAQSLGILQGKDGKPWTKLVAYYDGESLGNGKEQVQAFFVEKTPLRDRIEADIHQRMESGQWQMPSQGETRESEESKDDAE